MSPRRPSEEEREASSFLFFFFRIPARKQNLQQGAERFLGPRVAEGQHLQESVLCWWRCVLGETKATNYPPSPSQGQGWWVWRETSCRSLDLRGCASPFLCPGGIYAEWPWSQFGLGGDLCKTTRGSHGIALLSHLTWAQWRFYKKRKKSLTTDVETRVWHCEIPLRLLLNRQPTSTTNVCRPTRYKSRTKILVISLFCFVFL